MSHFYRPIPYVDTIKANIKLAEHERAIRLFCDQAGRMWALQVRAPITLANGREGKDFMIATAKLDREDLVALRDAIDAMLTE